MKWKDKLLSEFIDQLKRSNGNCESIIYQILNNDGIGVHMAIFNEPYLTALIEGKKTIESRFSLNRVSPFRKVHKGDVVLIKKTAGSVIGFFFCGTVEFWVKSGKISLKELELKYSQAICSDLDPTFWKRQEKSKYASFIHIDKVNLLIDFKIDKKDRTAWTVIKERYKPSIFDDLIKFHE